MVDDNIFRHVVSQLENNDRKLASVIDQQGRVLGGLQQDQFKAVQKKALEELSANFTKNVASVYDTATKYSNMVTLAGYAAFFAIWNGTKTYIASELIYLISALFVGISAAIFVFFEVYKMQLMTERIKDYRATIEEIVNLYNSGQYAVGLNKFEEIKADEAKRLLSTARVGRVCLYSSLVTGLLGAGSVISFIAAESVRRIIQLL